MLRAAAAAAATSSMRGLCSERSVPHSPSPKPACYPCHSVCSSTIQFKLRAQFAQCESCESVGGQSAVCVCVCVSLCVNSYKRQLMLSLRCPCHPPLSLPLSLSRSTSAASALSILHTACLANILEIRVVLSV